MTYAQQLKAIREDMLETQQQFANRIGITQCNLSQLESGVRIPSRRRHNDTIVTLRDAAGADTKMIGMITMLDHEFNDEIANKKRKATQVARITLNATGTGLMVQGKNIDKEFVIRHTNLLDVAEMKRVVERFNDLICKVAM